MGPEPQGRRKGLGEMPREEKSEATPDPLFVLSSLEGHGAEEMQPGPPGGRAGAGEGVGSLPHRLPAGYLW